MSNIQYQYFPKSDIVPEALQKVISVFKIQERDITSLEHNWKSDEVLHLLADNIKALGYMVEVSKCKEDKIRVPVLFGRNGSLEKYFEADCYNPKEKVVVEIEAGRAVSNYQFLKDLFQACVMHDIDYLIIAVRNIYRESKDFEKVIGFLDTLYTSHRLSLPLKGILIIGY